MRGAERILAERTAPRSARPCEHDLVIHLFIGGVAQIALGARDQIIEALNLRRLPPVDAREANVAHDGARGIRPARRIGDLARRARRPSTHALEHEPADLLHRRARILQAFAECASRHDCCCSGRFRRPAARTTRAARASAPDPAPAIARSHRRWRPIQPPAGGFRHRCRKLAVRTHCARKAPARSGRCSAPLPWRRRSSPPFCPRFATRRQRTTGRNQNAQIPQQHPFRPNRRLRDLWHTLRVTAGRANMHPRRTPLAPLIKTMPVSDLYRPDPLFSALGGEFADPVALARPGQGGAAPGWVRDRPRHAIDEWTAHWGALSPCRPTCPSRWRSAITAINSAPTTRSGRRAAFCSPNCRSQGRLLDLGKARGNVHSRRGAAATLKGGAEVLAAEMPEALGLYLHVLS